MSSSNGNGIDNEKHYEQLLPWLVNGTLSDEEAHELELALAKSENLRREYELLKRLQQQVKQQTMPDVPMEFAWQRMKQQIATNKIETKKLTLNKEARWRNIAIAASVLFVIQSSVLLIPSQQDDRYTPLSSSSSNSSDSSGSSDSGAVKQNAAHFTLQFVETASASAIQRVLRENQLSIIAGPSSVGLYRVSGPADSKKDAPEILSQLRSQTDIIAHVQNNE